MEGRREKEEDGGKERRKGLAWAEPSSYLVVWNPA